MHQKSQQKSLTIQEQLNNLKELGMIIENEDEAASFLNDVSYFRLVKAFSLGLKEKNGDYYDGVSFNQIKELYLFNCSFRQLLFKQLERIEVNLRCRISNHFSSAHGVLGYEDVSLFKDAMFHEFFLKEAANEIQRNKRAPFIRNFQENYVDGKIPLYALVEILSFGTLSKLYKNMLNADKKAIAGTFRIPYPYLESWIESFAYVRNICAHYGRLYNAKLAKRPQLYNEDQSKGINNQYIFGVLVCMKHILGGDPTWKKFVTGIMDLFDKYPYVQKETMGFPENWTEYLLCQ